MSNPGQFHTNNARYSNPMKKFWKSDFYLDSSEATTRREQVSAVNCNRPMICVSDEEVNGRESLADDTFLCDPLLGTKSVSEELWTKTVAETINNVSRECLDRLAKLESENKQLRKQYENLEAQITPLVKSLKAQERHPENGRTPQTPVNCARQSFETQLRQMVSVLVHTNMAQNDIREDCRYLKHRVSNLETINARLFHMVQNQRHHVHCDHHSCQETSEHTTNSHSELWCSDENDEPRPMFPSMPGNQSYLATGKFNTVRVNQPIVPCEPHVFGNETTQFETGTAPRPQLPSDLSCSPATVDTGSPSATSPVTTALVSREKSAASAQNSVNNIESTIKERLLTGCFQSVLEGVLLRASSTPHFPLPDPDVHCLTVPYCPPAADDQMFPEASRLKFKPEDWPPTEEYNRIAARRTSFPLPAPSGISKSCCSGPTDYHDRYGQISPLRRRSSLPGMDDAVRSVLLPHAWLHMSILPETAVRRHPIGTRSHIILGARSLPLCMNHSVDKTSVSGASDSTKSTQSHTSHNAAVLATIGSPLSSRQIRGFHTQLNPIQEIEMKGESFYDLQSELRCNSLTTSSSRSSAILGNSTSDSHVDEDSNTQTLLDQKVSKLRRMRRVLFRDSKRRYLYPLRLPVHTNSWNKEQPGPRILDLELASYLQTLMHNARESQRNLRYGVFSDTELLTGKFTITSYDDSAIDTGDDDGDGLQSSHESLEASETTRVEEIVQLGGSHSALDAHVTCPSEESVLSDVRSSESDGNKTNHLKDLLPDNRLQLANDFQKTSPHTSSLPLTEYLDQQITGQDNVQTKNSTRLQVEDEAYDQDDRDIVEDLEENGGDEQPRRQQRPNIPPPVVIHRRRFGTSESTENISPDPMLPIDEVDELLAQTLKLQTRTYKQLRSPLVPASPKESTLKPEITLINFVVPSENQVHNSGGESAHSDSYGTSTMMTVFTNTTTSSTTESTSGSDLNEVSSQTTNLSNSSGRLNWLIKRTPNSAETVRDKIGNRGSRKGNATTTSNKKVHTNARAEREHQSQKRVGSSYSSISTGVNNGPSETSEYLSKPTRVSDDFWTQESFTSIPTLSPSSRRVLTADPISHSTVSNPRPATSPRARRQAWTQASQSSPVARIANSTRSLQTAQLSISSKSSPNSPEFSPGGRRRLRTMASNHPNFTSAAGSPNDRGTNKGERTLPSQSNGAIYSKKYSRGTSQTTTLTGFSSYGIGDGSEISRFNRRTQLDPNTTPAPPPIPPRTSSRTQGYQTKTTTIARPDPSFQRSPLQADIYSPSSISQPSLVDSSWPRFVDSPRFRNSSHSRNCSSTSSRTYSPQVNSHGVPHLGYQRANNVSTVHLTNDSKRSPTFNLSHSSFPRLPIPTARQDNQSYAWPTKPVEDGSPNLNSQDGSFASQVETQLTNLTVPTRCNTSGNKNMPRAEHRSHQTRNKTIPEVTGSPAPTNLLWDTRERHDHTSLNSQLSISQWSQFCSREQLRPRAYTKERSVRRGA